MLDYRLLQALAAVITQGGFEKAAQQLCLTQSAVSRRIKQLESLLGQPVLERSIPPKPTQAGLRLINHLQQVQQMEASLGLLAADLQCIKLATNADSLATWLPNALVLTEHSSVRFEFIIEDQSVSLRRMKHGEVVACICDSPQPIHGGAVMYLGALRYRAVATPTFAKTYQLNRACPQNFAKAPCLVFNEDDLLQHQFLQDISGQALENPHICPSSEGFLKSILAGLGFGLLPELQIKMQLDQGDLIDLAPDYALDTPLYWHYWQAESPLLFNLRQQIKREASRCLVQ